MSGRTGVSREMVYERTKMYSVGRIPSFKVGVNSHGNIKGVVKHGCAAASKYCENEEENSTVEYEPGGRCLAIGTEQYPLAPSFTGAV